MWLRRILDNIFISLEYDWRYDIINVHQLLRTATFDYLLLESRVQTEMDRSLNPMLLLNTTM